MDTQLPQKVLYDQSKKYCPDEVALEGSALWGNTLATTLQHDQNRTIPSGLTKTWIQDTDKKDNRLIFIFLDRFYSLFNKGGGKRIEC